MCRDPYEAQERSKAMGGEGTLTIIFPTEAEVYGAQKLLMAAMKSKPNSTHDYIAADSCSNVLKEEVYKIHT